MTAHRARESFWATLPAPAVQQALSLKIIIREKCITVISLQVALVIRM